MTAHFYQAISGLIAMQNAHENLTFDIGVIFKVDQKARKLLVGFQTKLVGLVLIDRCFCYSILTKVK